MTRRLDRNGPRAKEFNLVPVRMALVWRLLKRAWSRILLTRSAVFWVVFTVTDGVSLTCSCSITRGSLTVSCCCCFKLTVENDLLVESDPFKFLQ